MTSPTQAPADLAEWMKIRIDLLSKLVKDVQKAEKNSDDARQWTLELLAEMSNIEAVSRRATHLLTAYALRSRLAGAAEIAKKTNVTISTAQNRGGSRLAQEVWNEVWPPPK